MTQAGGGPRRLAGPVYEWDLRLPPGADAAAVSAAVRCVSPDGTASEIGAFVAGDRWVARLAAHQPGDWHWASSDGARGVLTVPPSEPGTRWPAGVLRVSDSRRYLERDDGRPFFYFADTAWLVVRRGTPEQWVQYLDHRVAQGFSVIQVNLLPWVWDPTAIDGDPPFHNGDPARPNDAFFARFDRFITLAAERGLVTCLMLLWGGWAGRLAHSHWTTEEAVALARYAVTRFAAYPMLWSLSGDSIYTADPVKWEAVGAAVEASDPAAHPTTMHLRPTENWRFPFHASAWHDFHMVQTGHARHSIADIAALPAAYRRLTPAKPCVNGEPWYEAHGGRDAEEFGPTFTAFDARFAFWTSILSGATMGHTYGSQGIWNWRTDARPGHPTAARGPDWHTALAHAGAGHCAVGARALRTVPWWALEPAPERVDVHPRPPDWDQRPSCAIVPGALWLVYLPGGGGNVCLRGIEPVAWRARWLDPRSGDAQLIARVEVSDNRKWWAPPPPTPEDWLLVLTLDDGVGDAAA